MPCLLKRVAIRLNNVVLSNGATALYFPIVFATSHSFYRDLYHLKYLNGKWVQSQEKIEPAEPSLQKFIGDKEFDPCVLSKFRKRHPCENVKYGIYKEKYLHLTERSDANDRHQGGDFLQEDCLGRVVSFLNAGKLFNLETFTFAVRKCGMYQESERIKGNHGQRVLSKRPKYTLEVQMMAAIVLDLNEDPMCSMDIGEWNDDIFHLAKIGMDNYKIFFINKLSSVKTGSIKLKPAFFTRKGREDYEKIENKTKEEIRTKINSVIDTIDFEDEDEKLFYVTRCSRSSIKKDELINLYNDMMAKTVLFSNQDQDGE